MAESKTHKQYNKLSQQLQDYIDNRKFEFTYLSDNIEKHAEPNNSLYYTNFTQMRKGCHPFLKSIPIYSIAEEDKPLFDALARINFISKDNDEYKAIKGFPKLFIKIHDAEIKALSKITNPEHYKFIEHNNFPRILLNNMYTINNIKVSDIKDNSPTKEGFMQILGDIEPEQQKTVMMFGKNRQTLFAAAKRQMKTAPNPSEKIAKDFLQFAIDTIENDIGKYLDEFSYNEAQWYSHLSAPKQQKIAPIRMYYQNPAEFNLLYSENEKLRILTEHYEAIVKSELQDPDGKPRMVCAIPDKIKYNMGPICWQLEEICAKHLRGYCGGMNLTEMADKINNYAAQGFTKVVEGDGSAFDNSQDVSLKALDRYIYNRILDKVYHVPKEDFRHIANLYYKTMDVKYHVDGKPKTMMTYKVLGTVFSGDSDTTLANTIRMAMYNIYVNERAGLKYNEDFIVFSKGDDFSVLYKQYISDDFIRRIYNTYFLTKPEGNFKIYDNRQFGIGQICKFLEIGDLASFKFCSLRSWYKNDNYDEITLTRNPQKLYGISRYAIKPKRYSIKQIIQYHIDQATAYEASYKNIEIFDIMAKAHKDEAAYLYNKYKDLPQMKKYFRNTFNKLAKQKQREEHYNFGFDEFYNQQLESLIGIKNREDYEDLILPSYWENMQLRYQVRTEINTKQEYEFINQQINEEFDTEELKSLVGQINNNEH